MRQYDLSPLYRSTIGFDRLFSMLDQASGVDSLRWLDAAEAKAREPEVRCEIALLSPETGVVDSHAFMLSLLGECEAAGGSLEQAHAQMRLQIGDCFRQGGF